MNSSQSYYFLFKVLAAVVFIFASYYSYLSFFVESATQISVYLIVLVFTLALILWFDIPRILAARRAFKKFQVQDIENINLTVNVDGVFSKTSSSQSHSGWEKFVKALENDELFLLVLESKNFLIFPKRNFPVKADINSFRELAKAKVAEYKFVK